MYVLWDFDGTLAHRPGMWTACLLDCLGATDLTAADIRPHLSSGFPWHEPDRAHHHLADPDTWWTHLTGILHQALLNAGAPTTAARQAADRVRHRYTDPTAWTVYPAAAESLATLAEAGWRNVILSNHVPELHRLVADLGLADNIHAVYSSATVGWEKPHPAFFQHVLAELDHPARIWMVGDNPVADIAGAHAAGIPAFLVAPATGPTLTDAVRTITAAASTPPQSL